MQRNSSPVEEFWGWTEQLKTDPKVSIADRAKDLRRHFQELTRMCTHLSNEGKHGARTGSGVIVLINQIGSAFYGPVLAVFVLTVATTRVRDEHAILGFAGGLIGNLMLAWLFPSVSWLGGTRSDFFSR